MRSRSSRSCSPGAVAKLISTLLVGGLLGGVAIGTVGPPSTAHATDEQQVSVGESDPAAGSGEANPVDPDPGASPADPAPGESGQPPEEVAPPATITEQPSETTVEAGAAAELRVVAAYAVSYRWQRLAPEQEAVDAAQWVDEHWTDLDAEATPSASTDALVFAATEAAQQGVYRVVVTGADGAQAPSEPAQLIVLPDPSADEKAASGGAAEASAPGARSLGAEGPQALAETGFRIVDQPENISAASGTSARLFADSDGGVEPVIVQWKRSTSLSQTTPPTSWTDVDRGATQRTFTFLVGSSPHVQNRWYKAVFTDATGKTVETSPVRLTILPTPTITRPLDSTGQTIRLGETATFTAEATSSTAMTMQWQSNRSALSNGDPDESAWSDMAGATGSTLRITGTDIPTQHGTFYRLVFTNAGGSVATQPAQLRFFERLDTRTSVTVTGESYGPTGVSTVNRPQLSAPGAVVHGEDIVIEGFSYLHPDGQRGSVSNALIDGAYSGDPNIFNTTVRLVLGWSGTGWQGRRWPFPDDCGSLHHWPSGCPA